MGSRPFGVTKLPAVACSAELQPIVGAVRVGIKQMADVTCTASTVPAVRRGACGKAQHVNSGRERSEEKTRREGGSEERGGTRSA